MAKNRSALATKVLVTSLRKALKTRKRFTRVHPSASPLLSRLPGIPANTNLIEVENAHMVGVIQLLRMLWILDLAYPLFSILSRLYLSFLFLLGIFLFAILCLLCLLLAAVARSSLSLSLSLLWLPWSCFICAMVW